MKEILVKTKIAKKFLELIGWECVCRRLSYKTWKIQGYYMQKARG